MEFRGRPLFGQKKGCKVPRNHFLPILLAGESKKKRGGKRGRTGGGGGIDALSYGTVLPHIELNLIVYCISSTSFF